MRVLITSGVRRLSKLGLAGASSVLHFRWLVTLVGENLVGVVHIDVGIER